MKGHVPSHCTKKRRKQLMQRLVSAKANGVTVNLKGESGKEGPVEVQDGHKGRVDY